MRINILVLLMIAVFGLVDIADAYVGPGLGAGAIGVILGIIGSIFLAIFAIFWYPIKRLLKKFKKSEFNKNEPADKLGEKTETNDQ